MSQFIGKTLRMVGVSVNKKDFFLDIFFKTFCKIVASYDNIIGIE